MMQLRVNDSLVPGARAPQCVLYPGWLLLRLRLFCCYCEQRQRLGACVDNEYSEIAVVNNTLDGIGVASEENQ